MKFERLMSIGLICMALVAIFPGVEGRALIKGVETTESSDFKESAISDEKREDDVANTLTIEEFTNYLNQNYNTVNVSFGSMSFSHEISEVFIPSYTARYDYWIRTDFFGSLPYELKYGTRYSDTQIKEVKVALCDFQKKIYDEATRYFPRLKFKGGFYHDWYNYPYIQEDLESIAFLSWVNYDKVYDLLGEKGRSKISGFHWIPDSDEYDFTDVSTLPCYRISDEIDDLF